MFIDLSRPVHAVDQQQRNFSTQHQEMQETLGKIERLFDHLERTGSNSATPAQNVPEKAAEAEQPSPAKEEPVTSVRPEGETSEAVGLEKVA